MDGFELGGKEGTELKANVGDVDGSPDGESVSISDPCPLLPDCSTAFKTYIPKQSTPTISALVFEQSKS